MKVKSLSRVQFSVTPWTVAYQASPCMGFSRQEYWSGVPLPSPIQMVDVSFSPLPFASLIFSAICKVSSDNHFAPNCGKNRGFGTHGEQDLPLLLTAVNLGERNCYPVQYSCLENPVDSRAWWAAIYGVAQSRA